MEPEREVYISAEQVRRSPGFAKLLERLNQLPRPLPPASGYASGGLVLPAGTGRDADTPGEGRHGADPTKESAMSSDQPNPPSQPSTDEGTSVTEESKSSGQANPMEEAPASPTDAQKQQAEQQAQKESDQG